MIYEDVVICGVCKNIAEHMHSSLAIMEKIGQMFRDYKIVVYENNSEDDTLKGLYQWGIRNPRVTVLSHTISDYHKEGILNFHENGSPFKPEVISRARNLVLQRLKNVHFNKYKYIIWMDMDFVIEPNYDGITEVFKNPEQEWDAIFANGIAPNGGYWDWFAFRDENEPFGPELIGHDEWYVSKERSLVSSSDSWYPVYSAFGGCGIYKKEALLSSSYSANITNDLALWANKFQNQFPKHSVVMKYKETTQKLKPIIDLNSKRPGIISESFDWLKNVRIAVDFNYNVIWRMNSFVCNFPAVCEHVTLHASMILRGYSNLFINPRLVFYY